MTHQIDRRTALMAAAGFAFTAGPARAAAASSKLVRRGDRLFLAARINGVAVEGLLDSAAETSLLSPALAARLGLGGGEAAQAHGSGASAISARLVEHVRIAAAGVQVADATVAVIDLSDVSRRLTGRPIELVVGREIFDATRLHIDIPGGVIWPLAAQERPRGVELPLAEQRGLMLLPASVEGAAPTNMEFDLGNGTGVILSRRYAEKLGLFDGRPVTTALGGGLGGAKPRQGLVVKQLSVAGRSFAHMHVDIDDAPDAQDGNIGVGILQHFRITTDFPNHRLWLEAV